MNHIHTAQVEGEGAGDDVIEGGGGGEGESYGWGKVRKGSGRVPSMRARVCIE